MGDVFSYSRRGRRAKAALRLGPVGGEHVLPTNELALTLDEAYTHGTSTYLAVAEDLSALIAAGQLETTGVVRVFDDDEWVILKYAGVDQVNDRLTDLSAAAPRNASALASGHVFAVGSSVWGCVAADYFRSLLDNTNPATQAFGDAASPGTAEVAARRDHKHGMPAEPINALLEAKGDIISASAAHTKGRLAVGSDGQVLTADEASDLGVKWAAGGGVSTQMLHRILLGVRFLG